MDRILLITNAEAGTNDDEAIDEAVTVLREFAEVETAATSDPAELDDVLDRRDGRDLVVAGGDGSLHAVVAALTRRDELDDTTIGLIPLGTGNDFARGVQIPLQPAAAAHVVGRGRLARIDVLVDDENGVVVNAVHAGIGAEAGREAKPWKARLGKLGYVVGAVIAGFTSEGNRVRVVADGSALADGSRRVLQVGVGNGSFVGGGTPLMPDADPTDGLADVIVSFSVRRRNRLLYAIHLNRGTHDERHDVRTARATRVEVSGEPFYCNADGELTGPFRSRRWELRAAAFTMMLPTPDQAVPSN
ncbi:MAG: diacylglycerol kinase family protein [Nocardioidaceae bacterium]